MRKICSDNEKFFEHLEQLSSWFEKRGYPKSLVDSQLDQVKAQNREELFIKKSRSTSGIPFVVTYSPGLANIGSILKKYIHNEDQLVKKICTPAPFVSYRSAYSLRNQLVRAKVPSFERETGCKHCDSKLCLTCNNLSSTDTFKSTNTGEEFKINHEFNCNSKNVIYLFSCKVCGIQYVGQTRDRFRLRWNNYKSEARRMKLGGQVQQKELHNHFLMEDHNDFEENCSVTIIDKTDAQNPTKR